MPSRYAATLAAMMVCTAAPAATLSAQGLLAADNPNDVALIEFETSAAAALDAQTWSFGGGVNAAGQAVAAGGFDPYVSLFAGWGGAATFLVSNDDGLCPPGTAAPSCADSTLHVGSLPAGRYTIAISQPANFSFAENLGSGTLGDGFIGLAASWSGGACAASCSSAYAVDITSTALVPEPGAALLLALGLLTLALRRHV
ncbi:DVUA0089 family protein [Roseateles sp. NT4]|uniref:DVUA0089 family protein n=1 Tax=Roseateles sp. NT4 TaxID=3453715 RepID=UPI003EEB16A4